MNRCIWPLTAFIILVFLLSLDISRADVLATGRIPLALVVKDSAVYWSDFDGIYKTNFLGTVQLAESLGFRIHSLAVDENNLYFTSEGPLTMWGPNGTVGAIPLNADISTPKSVIDFSFVTGLFYTPIGLTLDQDSIYVVQRGFAPNLGRIIKIDKNTKIITELATAENAPSAIAINNEQVFWTVIGGGVGKGSIRNVSKSGGELKTLASGLTHPNSLVIADGWLYWTEGGGVSEGTIRRIQTKGGEVETLISKISYPYALAIDQGFMYWTELVGNIRRVPISGGQPTTLAKDLEYPVALAVKNNNLYYAEIFGNRIASIPVTSSVTEPEPLQDIWKLGAPMPFPVFMPGTAAVGDKIYVAGGGFYGGLRNELQVYDTKTNIWSLGPQMPVKRQSMATAVLGTKIYFIGGLDYVNRVETFVNDVRSFDTSTNEWSSAPKLNIARYMASAIVLDNKIYVFGGWTPNGATNSVEVFDPEVGVWQMKEDVQILQPRGQHVALTLNGKVYIISGSDPATNPTNTVYVWTPENNTWDEVALLHFSRVGFAAGVVENKMYVAGGLGLVTHPHVEFYDSKTNRWQFTTPLPFNTGDGATGAVIGNKFYVIGGGSNIPPPWMGDLQILEPACQPAPETCNGIDDNCNTIMDEDNVCNDIANCGFFRNACSAVQNAITICTNGVCGLSCKPNYYDIDKKVETGCEYFCIITNNGIEIADGKDNNCNGKLLAEEEDNDGDTYSELDGDCNDFNDAIHPEAKEICFNNIDDNCNGLADAVNEGCTANGIVNSTFGAKAEEKPTIFKETLSAPVLGNGVCETRESQASACTDCGCPTNYACVDNKCVSKGEIYVAAKEGRTIIGKPLQIITTQIISKKLPIEWLSIVFAIILAALILANYRFYLKPKFNLPKIAEKYGAHEPSSIENAKSFVAHAIAEGYDISDVRESLLKAGWDSKTVTHVFAESAQDMAELQETAELYNIHKPSNAIEQLTKYVNFVRTKGYTEPQIKAVLLASGWPKEIIDKVIKE